MTPAQSRRDPVPSRRPRRLSTTALSILLVGLLAAVGVAAAESQPPEAEPIRGFDPASARAELEAEAVMAARLDPELTGRDFRWLTEEPHPSGSERVREIAETLRDRFREFGLDEVELHRYDVLLPLPERVRVRMLEPRPYQPTLREDPYEVDPDTRVDAGPTYLGMSGSGDVTGELIYAHSGNREDYDWLEAQGIDPAGKIAIVRYSVPYSYRGFKAWEAERRGVKALLIYSDPAEDGHLKGEVFPEGPWGPESHIQRGAITYDFIVPGDPLTPGWASVEGAERIPRDEARSRPEIIGVPMSWRDARPLLEALGGPEAPESWQGGLDMTYRVGPGPATVNVDVQMDGGTRPIWVVEGRIRGAERPDETVVLGNHIDAWVYGGVDPSSGTASLLQLARALGEAVRQGHRPRRTIVLGAWDAEEWHLTGSTEWGEDNAGALRRGGVAYLNLDSASSGPFFSASAVASLDPLVLQAARDTAAPDGDGSLLEYWRNQGEGGETTSGGPERPDDVGTDDAELVVNSLGSGSDYTVFLNFLGMPIVSMGFDGPYGVYHSLYDDYYWMTQFGDPGFRRMTTAAELWGRMALRLANAPVLPYDFSLYADTVAGFVDELGAAPEVQEHLDLAPVRQAVDRWRTAAGQLETALEALLADSPDGAVLAEVNDRLLRLERAFLLEDGIPGRPWFKHSLYAPKYTYAAMSLPGVTEAAAAGDWQTAAAQVDALVGRIDRLTADIHAAREAL